MAMRVGLAGLFATGPGQSLLYVPDLYQRLLGDRQRFDQHCHVTQRHRYGVHVFFIVNDVLCHEAVLLFDASLGEIAREAEILPAVDAGHAVTVRARAPNHRHDQVAHFDPCDVCADRNDFAQ